MDSVQTERLLLRPWEDADREPFVGIFTKPELMWFPMKRALTPDEAGAMFDRIRGHWDEHGWGLWCAVRTDADEKPVIGFVGLAIPKFLPEILPAVEVGWRIDPSAWGCGLATEGGAAALAYGFDEMGLDRIVSIYEPDNAKSGAVMERLGMRFWRDTVVPASGVAVRVYELGNSQWDRARAPDAL